MLLNVIDLEATCWQGSPPPGEVNEIIEIGVCVLDLSSLERVHRRSILVRPARSTVSSFCTQLTSLTQEMVDAGTTLADACSQLRTDLDSPARPWASWGEYDRNQFLRQCDQDAVPYPFGEVHLNAKQIYAQAYGLPRRAAGMAQALQHAGLPLVGRHHRGDDDAWNIAALITRLARDGHWPGQPAIRPESPRAT